MYVKTEAISCRKLRSQRVKQKDITFRPHMLLRNLIQRKREIVYDPSTKRNVVYLLQLKLISFIYAPKESEHKPC